MSDDNVTRFPIPSYKVKENRRGLRAVHCLVTGRWLMFEPTSKELTDGHYVFVDVMTDADPDKPRKLCQLCISKEDLQRALENID